MEFECVNHIYTQTPKGKPVGIHVIPKDQFIRLLRLRYPRMPMWIAKLYRGVYLSSGNIYIKSGVKWGFKKLVDHEMGHADGLGHTWKPTTMNPVWLLRWFK